MAFRIGTFYDKKGKTLTITDKTTKAEVDAFAKGCDKSIVDRMNTPLELTLRVQTNLAKAAKKNAKKKIAPKEDK